jgi:hypothetical protein
VVMAEILTGSSVLELAGSIRILTWRLGAEPRRVEAELAERVAVGVASPVGACPDSSAGAAAFLPRVPVASSTLVGRPVRELKGQQVAVPAVAEALPQAGPLPAECLHWGSVVMWRREGSALLAAMLGRASFPGMWSTN